MFKRPRFIVLAILVLLALGLLCLPGRVADRLKVTIGSLFLPLFGLTSSAQIMVDKATTAVVPRQALVNQIEQLQRENQSLRFRALQAEEIFKENERLRQHFGLDRQSVWKSKLARVVGRDPANWWRTMTIDRGSRDGLRPNLPIIAQEGLVGRIAMVGLTQSQVVMVGDPNCLVSVLVQETRDNGMIEPVASAVADPSVVALTHLSRSSALQPGQKVYTSGLSSIYPKGIYVGMVVDSVAADQGLYTEARIKLAADLSRLEEVWVLLP